MVDKLKKFLLKTDTEANKDYIILPEEAEETFGDSGVTFLPTLFKDNFDNPQPYESQARGNG